MHRLGSDFPKNMDALCNIFKTQMRVTHKYFAGIIAAGVFQQIVFNRVYADALMCYFLYQIPGKGCVMKPDYHMQSGSLPEDFKLTGKLIR